jgi:hypothetical protein
MNNFLKFKNKLKGILFLNGDQKRNNKVLSYLPRIILGFATVLFVTFLFPFLHLPESQVITMTPWQSILPFFIRFVQILLVLLFFLIFLYLLKKEVLESFSQLLIIAILVVAEMALGYF